MKTFILEAAIVNTLSCISAYYTYCNVFSYPEKNIPLFAHPVTVKLKESITSYYHLYQNNYNMMTDLWLSLPVKDVAKSKAFFSAVGFSFPDSPGNTPTSIAMVVGSKNTVVMLFEKNMFRQICRNDVSDAHEATEVMISVGAESREEVDEIAEKAEDAGGNVFGRPAEVQGWMYGCAFADPDGHRWNILYMDMGNMPQQ